MEAYFSKYGHVQSARIMRNPATQQSRGFGFVTFADSSSVSATLKTKPHILDGRQIDPKPAVPRQSPHGQRSNQSASIKKVFVGGLDQETSEEDLLTYFSQFGLVEDVSLQRDRETQRPRGFGFVTFGSEEDAAKAMDIKYHLIGSRQVEVKPAFPRNSTSRRSSQGSYGVAIPQPPLMTPMMMAGSPPVQGFQYMYPGYGFAAPQGYNPMTVIPIQQAPQYVYAMTPQQPASLGDVFTK